MMLAAGVLATMAMDGFQSLSKPATAAGGKDRPRIRRDLVYGTVLDLLRRGIRSCMLNFEARRAERSGSDQPRAVVFIDRTSPRRGCSR